jgi:hypothetical protein
MASDSSLRDNETKVRLERLEAQVRSLSAQIHPPSQDSNLNANRPIEVRKRAWESWMELAGFVLGAGLGVGFAIEEQWPLVMQIAVAPLTGSVVFLLFRMKAMI